MQRITTIEQLKKEILLLEVKQAHERALLKEQFHNTYESLKPGNLIKKTLKDIVNTPDLKSGILGSAVSIAAGYLSKKAVVGSAPGAVRGLLGSALQMIVTKFVAKKAQNMSAAKEDNEEEEDQYTHPYNTQSETRL